MFGKFSKKAKMAAAEAERNEAMKKGPSGFFKLRQELFEWQK